MDKIQLFDKTFKPFMPYDDIAAAIDRLAEKLNADYSGKDDIPALVCVLNGSILFTAELLKRLNFPLELISMKLSSYEGTATTGNVREVMGLTGSVEGKRVLIVEDIVDTGGTLVALDRIMHEKGAREVKVCTLLLKPEVYKQNVEINYVGIKIPNRFIVGFGLDYNEIGRNLKDIYVLDA